MKIIKDNIHPALIKGFRGSIFEETRTVRDFLGIGKSEISSALPIRSREILTWALVDSNNSPIAVLTYQKYTEEVFIKMLYVVPNCRCKGYASELLSKFCGEYGNVSMQINKGNDKMYALVEKLGFIGEGSGRLKEKGIDGKPKWWSRKREE